jgi:hypothetical protein
MRPLIAILGLLLCFIGTRADELPVIKDSEAPQYVGKTVEVRGFVVPITTSPLGTTFINFGREYPSIKKRAFFHTRDTIELSQTVVIAASSGTNTSADRVITTWKLAFSSRSANLRPISSLVVMQPETPSRASVKTSLSGRRIWYESRRNKPNYGER